MTSTTLQLGKGDVRIDASHWQMDNVDIQRQGMHAG